MKTPTWEQTPGALVSLINGGQFVYAHLYTITLAGMTGSLFYTDADCNITDGLTTWDGRSLPIDQEKSRTRARWKRGLDVDTWRLVTLPRRLDPVTGSEFPDRINGVPWIQAVANGALDGADVQVDRAYFSAWPQPYQLTATPVGILTVFAGRPGDIDISETMVVINLNDYRELLRTKMPRNTFQAGCRHTLFDEGCRLISSHFPSRGSVIGGTTPQTIQSGPLTPLGSGTFALGRMMMISGDNAGFVRTVKSWDDTAPGTFDLLNPFPFDVIPGDIFDVFPGCDKTRTACAAFGNTANFGGQPFIPQAETAV